MRKSVEIVFGSVVKTKWDVSHVVVDLTMESKKDFQTLELIDGDARYISKLAGSTDGSYVVMLVKMLTLEEIIAGITRFNGSISSEFEDLLRENFARHEKKTIDIIG